MRTRHTRNGAYTIDQAHSFFTLLRASNIRGNISRNNTRANGTPSSRDNKKDSYEPRREESAGHLRATDFRQ